ncbi:hypothetical protein WICANDRAFT_28229, partial [Wickerhamomyces anomalus NRRL Y-366-8]
NRVIELQKLYQSSPKPLWMKHPRSKFYIYPFWALFTGVTAINLYYTGRAILGIKDPKK